MNNNYRLSMQGHDFLEDLRNQKVWDKIKNQAFKSGAKLTWTFITAATEQIMHNATSSKYLELKKRNNSLSVNPQRLFYCLKLGAVMAFLGVLGFFGKVPFTCSSEQVATFKDLGITHSSRYATHDVIREKPVSEYIGPSKYSLKR